MFPRKTCWYSHPQHLWVWPYLLWGCHRYNRMKRRSFGGPWSNMTGVVTRGGSAMWRWTHGEKITRRHRQRLEGCSYNPGKGEGDSHHHQLGRWGRILPRSSERACPTDMWPGTSAPTTVGGEILLFPATGFEGLCHGSPRELVYLPVCARRTFWPGVLGKVPPNQSHLNHKCKSDTNFLIMFENAYRDGSLKHTKTSGV